MKSWIKFMYGGVLVGIILGISHTAWGLMMQPGHGVEEISDLQGDDSTLQARSGQYGGGSGTTEDPYQLGTAEHLVFLGGDSDNWDKHFVLMGDINMTGVTMSPIGNFTGSFDGGDFTISNLFINMISNDYAGLFGVIGNSGLVAHLDIKQVIIRGKRYVGGLCGFNDKGTITHCHVTGSVKGNYDVGGLCGQNVGGTITHCTMTGSVSGDLSIGGLSGWNSINGTITDCTTAGAVTGDNFVGGVSGHNWTGSTISWCTSTGAINGKDDVGGVCGYNNNNGTISESYATGPVRGRISVGGVCGYNNESMILRCHATGAVNGRHDIGGVCGYNNQGTITRSYAIGAVNGRDDVGGLCGYNDSGTIEQCYATGSVTGGWALECMGGLCGSNFLGTISECYATGSVSGGNYALCLGGLCGGNVWGVISQCYATGSVNGGGTVGGVCGYNGVSTISQCYALGAVSGSGIAGGVCGYNDQGTITQCIWDIETSGTIWSHGGTGLPTVLMQTTSTFSAAGWDLMTPIWLMREGEYPRLWWEGVEAALKITPRTLNCRSQGKWVTAHLTLPAGYTLADIDPNTPAILLPMDLSAERLMIFVSEDGLSVKMNGSFDRAAFCEAVSDISEDITVLGYLADGSVFYGKTSVRIIAPGLMDLAELSSRWLQSNCALPDWCVGLDLNRDSMVNMLDFARLQKSRIEFIDK